MNEKLSLEHVPVYSTKSILKQMKKEDSNISFSKKKYKSNDAIENPIEYQSNEGDFNENYKSQYFWDENVFIFIKYIYF